MNKCPVCNEANRHNAAVTALAVLAGLIVGTTLGFMLGIGSLL